MRIHQASTSRARTVSLAKARAQARASKRAATSTKSFSQKASSFGSKNTSARLKSGGRKNSFLDNILGKNSNSDRSSALLNNLRKGHYSEIKEAADGLQEHSAKLLSEKSDSLFSKAMSTTGKDGKELTEKEIAENKSAVVSEIDAFLTDYNTMVNKMYLAGDNINETYLKLMKSCVAKNEAELKDMGITSNYDGTLSVRKKVLSNSELTKMKKVFGTKNGMTDQLTARSRSVETNAQSKLGNIDRSAYSSNYNRYGKNYGYSTASTNRFNMRG